MSATTTPSRSARLVRAVALVLAAVGATAAAGRLFWATGSDALAALTTGGPATPLDLLMVTACAAGLVLTGWLGLGVLLATAAAVPGLGGRALTLVADRWTPALVRRAVAAALGGALVAGLPSIAHADTPRPGPVATRTTVAPAPDPAFTVTGSTLTVDGSTTPAPTNPSPRVAATTAPSSPGTATAAPDPAFTATSESAARPTPTLGPLGPAPGRTGAAAPTPTAPGPATVRVERGDTLWAIAARHLGAHAGAAAVVREWHRWYAANRALVGADPDLIVPGQVLTAPGPATGPTSGDGGAS